MSIVDQIHTMKLFATLRTYDMSCKKLEMYPKDTDTPAWKTKQTDGWTNRLTDGRTWVTPYAFSIILWMVGA